MVRPGARSTQQQKSIGTRSKSPAPPTSASASLASSGSGDKDESPQAGDQSSPTTATAVGDHEEQKLPTERGDVGAKDDEEIEETERDEEVASLIMNKDKADPMMDESERSGLGDSQRSTRSGGTRRGKTHTLSKSIKPVAVPRSTRGRRAQAKPTRARAAKADPPGPPPRKKRGLSRWRKEPLFVAASEDASDGEDDDESALPPLPKRRPGRTRKVAVAEDANDDEESAEDQGDEETVDAADDDDDDDHDSNETATQALRRRRPRRGAAALQASDGNLDVEDAEDQADEVAGDTAGEDNAESVVDAPQKRRPGRQRKAPVSDADATEDPDEEDNTEDEGDEAAGDAGDDDNAESVATAPQKRRSGKPRRAPATEDQDDKASLDAPGGDVDESAALATRKRRAGRARKVADTGDSIEDRGDKAMGDAAGGDDDDDELTASRKRRPGRQRKVAAASDRKGDQDDSTAADVGGGDDEPPAPRRRGRLGKPQNAPDTTGGDADADDDALPAPRKRGRPGRQRGAPVPVEVTEAQDVSETASGDDDELPPPRKRGRWGRARKVPVAAVVRGDGEESIGELKASEGGLSPPDHNSKVQENHDDAEEVDATGGADDDGPIVSRKRGGRPQDMLVDEGASVEEKMEEPKDLETRPIPPTGSRKLPGNQGDSAVANVPGAGGASGHARGLSEKEKPVEAHVRRDGVDVVAKLVRNDELSGDDANGDDDDADEDSCAGKKPQKAVPASPSEGDRPSDDHANLAETSHDDARLKPDRLPADYASSGEHQKVVVVSGSDSQAQEDRNPVHDRDETSGLLENPAYTSAEAKASTFVESPFPPQTIEALSVLGTTDREVGNAAMGEVMKLTMESKIPRKSSRRYSSGSVGTANSIEDANRQHHDDADVEVRGQEAFKFAADGCKLSVRDGECKIEHGVEVYTKERIANKTIDIPVRVEDRYSRNEQDAEKTASSAAFPVPAPRVDLSYEESISANEKSPEELPSELGVGMEPDRFTAANQERSERSDLENATADIRRGSGPAVDIETRKAMSLQPSEPLDRRESPNDTQGDLSPTVIEVGRSRQSDVFQRQASRAGKPSAQTGSLAGDECNEEGKQEKLEGSCEESTKRLLSIVDHAEKNDGADSIIVASNESKMIAQNLSIAGDSCKEYDEYLETSKKSPGAEDASQRIVGSVNSSPSSCIRKLAAASDERALTTDSRTTPIEDDFPAARGDEPSSSQLDTGLHTEIIDAANSPENQAASSCLHGAVDAEMSDAIEKTGGDPTSMPHGDALLADKDASELGQTQVEQQPEISEAVSKPIQEKEFSQSSSEADNIENVQSSLSLHDDATSDCVDASSLSEAMATIRPIPAFRISTPCQALVSSEPTTKKLSLQRVKMALFSLGRRIHGRIGYERLFSRYWSSFSFVLHGAGTLEKMLRNHRAIVEAFLKTKRLRNLHNKLVLGLLKICYQTELLRADGDSPSLLDDRNIHSEGKGDPQTAESNVKPIGMPVSKTRPCPPYSALVSVPTSESSVKRSYPVRTSFRIPGATAIDPYVREVASTAGMSVSENAIWLLVIAMKEFAQTALRNCVQMKSAIEAGDVPPMPLIRQRVVHRKRDIGNHNSESVSGKNPEPSAKKCITALDVFTLVSSMSIGGARAIGGTISRTAFERSLSASHEATIEPHADGFDELKDFITSKILPPLRMNVKYEEPIPNKSLDSSGATTSSAVPMVSSTPSSKPRSVQGGGGLGRGAKDLGALRTRSITQRNAAAATVSATTSQAATNASRNPSYEPQACGPPALSPFTRAESTSNLAPVPQETSLSRSSPVAEPAPALSTDPNPQTINIVRRGKGFGVKNLAAMRARSITKPTDLEEEKPQGEGSSTISSDPASSSSTSAVTSNPS